MSDYLSLGHMKANLAAMEDWAVMVQLERLSDCRVRHESIPLARYLLHGFLLVCTAVQHYRIPTPFHS